MLPSLLDKCAYQASKLYERKEKQSIYHVVNYSKVVISWIISMVLSTFPLDLNCEGLGYRWQIGCFLLSFFIYISIGALDDSEGFSRLVDWVTREWSPFQLLWLAGRTHLGQHSWLL